MLILYLSCAISIISPLCTDCIPSSVFKVLIWLGYFNSAMNPVIYSIFNSEFRHAFQRILVGTECCDRPARRKSRSTTEPMVVDKPQPRSASLELCSIRANIELKCYGSEGKSDAI